MNYKNLVIETCESDLIAVSDALNHFITATIELRLENAQLMNEVASLTDQLSVCCPSSSHDVDFFNL